MKFYEITNRIYSTYILKIEILAFMIIFTLRTASGVTLYFNENSVQARWIKALLQQNVDPDPRW